MADLYNIHIIISERQQRGNESQKDLHILTSDLVTRFLHAKHYI